MIFLKRIVGIMKKLSCVEIISLFIGVIMGAGFASGREAWQFFGVFGTKGYYGAVLVSICFIILACMLSYIAISKQTSELGELISPIDNNVIKQIIAYILAAIYYSMIVAMSAAGGALLHQQFGINKMVGGAVIVVLVIITVLGDFDRVSKIFRLIVPLLFTIGIITILLVIKADFQQSGAVTGYKPSELAPNWIFSSIIFLAYNTLGMITMIGSSAVHAINKRHAYLGASIGAVLLGLLTILLLRALLTDMAYSESLSLPMLGYSARINPVLNGIYAIVLYGAIYSTATSTYYGFSTKIPNNRFKQAILIIAAVVGFILGLTGFKNLVEYLYPAQGYIGIIFIVLIIINFFKTILSKRIS